MFAKRRRAEVHSDAVSRHEAAASSDGAQPARGRSAALAREPPGAHADPRLVLAAGERGGVEGDVPEVRKGLAVSLAVAHTPTLVLRRLLAAGAGC